MLTQESVTNLLEFIRTNQIPDDEVSHYKRVMTYAYQNFRMYKYPLKINEHYISFVALAHDLIEDGYATIDELMTLVEKTEENAAFITGIILDLNLLTHNKSENYLEYIARIRKNSFISPSAYLVKLADIKDHLSQSSTLTERLKDKYVRALAVLL